MPAPPEFRDVHGAIGHLEILHESDTHHASTANGHVRIAGEITINLDCIAEHPLQQGESVVFARRHKNKINIRRDLIRDYKFLDGTQGELGEARFKIECCGAYTLFKLWQQVGGAIDWAPTEAVGKMPQRAENPWDCDRA